MTREPELMQQQLEMFAACPLDAPVSNRCEAEYPRKAAPISFRLAKEFIEKFHYLHELPKTVKENFGLFDKQERLVAVACYGPCHSARLPKRFLELRRLCRHPNSHRPLSEFLACTLQILKAEGVAAVITWADLKEGHHGGIYQASNWIYTEPYSYNWNYHFRKPDGTVVDHRATFAMFGTSSKDKILKLRPDWKAFLPAMKLRYLMPLNWRKQKCLAILKAWERPYPKPKIKKLPVRIPQERRTEFKLKGVS